MGLRLDGYIRVSRVGGREGEGYISPSVQKEAVAAYASELRGEIVKWSTDEDFSGGNTERPGFQATLTRLRGGQTDGVVVMRIDRFARSVADGAAVVREIVDAGQVFASCHERIDPRTPEGRYMLNSFLANAELFLDQAKASWWTSKSRAVARGAHIGPTPIGYRRIPKGREGAGCLEPDPTYGPAIRELFARAAKREVGDTALARWMTERAPRRAGRAWQSSEVRRWLSNRVYLGEVRYGSLLNTDAHQPLTDPETWGRCQRQAREQRRAASSFLLSGLVRCAACRYAMSGQTYGGSDQSTPVYRCHNRDCPGPSVIVARKLEEHVTGLIRRYVGAFAVEGAADNTDLSGMRAALDRAEEEVHTFAVDLDARRLLGEAGWQAGLRARVEARDTRRGEWDEAHAANQLVELARGAKDLDSHDLRDLLGTVRHVFVRRRPRGSPVADRALIVWQDSPAGIDVPGPHHSGGFEPVGW